MKYIKDNIVLDGYITVDGVNIYSPKMCQLSQYGWQVYQEPQPKKTYEQRVVELIREKYTLDAELAIQRQREEKAEDFAEYYAYCEECKRRAREELSIETEEE